MSSRRERLTTIALMGAAAVTEKMDEGVLPSVFLAVGASLGVGPAELGAVALCRALAQAAASPLAGALGDSLDRTRVVSVGCLLWALATLLLATATSLGRWFCWRRSTASGWRWRSRRCSPSSRTRCRQEPRDRFRRGRARGGVGGMLGGLLGHGSGAAAVFRAAKKEVEAERKRWKQRRRRRGLAGRVCRRRSGFRARRRAELVSRR